MIIASQLKKFANILQLVFSGETMPKKLSEKAIQARKYRCRARDKRQLDNVIACYVEHKYKEIYNECNGIYQVIKEKYPDIGLKCDLTKTAMFRRIISQFDSSDDESTTSTTTTVSSATLSTTTTAASPATLTPASPVTSATAASPATPTPASPVTSATAASPATPTPASPATSDETVNTPPETSPVQQQRIPVRHLYVGYNALGELVDQVTDEGEYVDMSNVDNDVFMDVIAELEEDNEIRDLLNNVEVQQLEEPLDKDEGIELGIAGEDDDFNDLFDF